MCGHRIVWNVQHFCDFTRGQTIGLIAYEKAKHLKPRWLGEGGKRGNGCILSPYVENNGHN